MHVSGHPVGQIQVYNMRWNAPSMANIAATKDACKIAVWCMQNNFVMHVFNGMVRHTWVYIENAIPHSCHHQSWVARWLWTAPSITTNNA